MTATIRKSPAPTFRRRPFRLVSMEALGFIDKPGVATTWTATQPAPVPPSASSPPSHTPDPFAEWTPTEIGSHLHIRKIRWGFLTGILVIAVGLSGVGFWIYQQPAERTAAAQSEVQADAQALRPELIALQQLNNTLLDADPGASTLISGLPGLDGAARALFEASAALPGSQGAARTHAANAASDALAASRLLGDAAAYRTAVIPILAVPEFETDSALIALDEAALGFGEWQSRFDSVRSALPSVTLSTVTAELDVISGELDDLHGRYLDALRADDRLGAISAVNELAGRLRHAEVLLYAGLAEVQAKIGQRAADAINAIDLLLG